MKYLKDLTTYSETDKFKHFRETLVNELQENLEIIDDNLGTGTSSGGGSGELELINERFSIGSGSSSYPYYKYGSLDKTTVSTIFNNYNQLVLGLYINTKYHWFTVDLRPSKLEKSQTDFYFNITYMANENDPTTWIPYVFKASVTYGDTYSNIVFCIYSSDTENTTGGYLKIYGSK